METIISACISAGAALLVCFLNNRSQQRKASEQNREAWALVEYKLDELTKRVDKHNSVVERTYKLEEYQAVIQEQIKVANHRIGDLEKEKEV